VPLEKLLKKAGELNEKAFERFDRDFSKGTHERDVFNFIYYHRLRNLRLTLLKIIDRLQDAKTRNLNPTVAKNLKGFMKPLSRFINSVEKVRIGEFSKTTELSEELESFRGEAEKYEFLCDLDEEIRYDKISKDDFKKLLMSIRDVDLDEDIDLNEDLYEKDLNDMDAEDTD